MEETDEAVPFRQGPVGEFDRPGRIEPRLELVLAQRGVVVRLANPTPGDHHPGRARINRHRRAVMEPPERRDHGFHSGRRTGVNGRRHRTHRAVRPRVAVRPVRLLGPLKRDVALPVDIHAVPLAIGEGKGKRQVHHGAVIAQFAAARSRPPGTGSLPEQAADLDRVRAVAVRAERQGLPFEVKQVGRRADEVSGRDRGDASNGRIQGRRRRLRRRHPGHHGRPRARQPRLPHATEGPDAQEPDRPPRQRRPAIRSLGGRPDDDLVLLGEHLVRTELDLVTVGPGDRAPPPLDEVIPHRSDAKVRGRRRRLRRGRRCGRGRRSGRRRGRRRDSGIATIAGCDQARRHRDEEHHSHLADVSEVALCHGWLLIGFHCVAATYGSAHPVAAPISPAAARRRSRNPGWWLRPTLRGGTPNAGRTPRGRSAHAGPLSTTTPIRARHGPWMRSLHRSHLPHF